MSDLIDRQALLNEYDKAHVGPPGKARKLIADAPTASPWHRVENELPPKATWVLTIATDGNVKIFNIATVDAGGQWWTYSPQKILRELYGVRYWMPIEPPKEDADAIK